MRKIAFSLAVALVLVSGTARGAAAPGFGPWVNEASRLLQATDQALVDLGRVADDPRAGLSPRHPNSASFRSSLAFLTSVVDRLAGTLAGRDPEFFGLLEQGSVALGSLRVAWARTGVRNDAITADVRLASASYRLLRSTYGLEGLRHRQGGELSDAERRQLQRLQRTQRRLAADLERLRDQARRRKDSALAAELDRFHQQAMLIAWAPLDLDSYLNALIATSEMRGEWRADASYVKKAVPAQDWTAANQTVEDLWVDADIGKVFMVDLGKPGDESPSDRDETPTAAEGAVQLYPAAAIDEVTEVGGEGEPVDEGEEVTDSAESDEPQPTGENGVVEEEDLEDLETPEADAVQTAGPSAAVAVKPTDEPAGKAGADPAAVEEAKPDAKQEPGAAKSKLAKPSKPAPRRADRRAKKPGIG